MQARIRPAALAVSLSLGVLISTETRAGSPTETNYVRGQFHELNDNGAWSWFMDERVIVDRGRLIVGSVRANGTFQDQTNPGWGNVELAVFDLASHDKRVVVLHDKLEQDDHDSPGLVVLPDGRYLAAYSKHNQEPRFYFRISTKPHDPFEWQPVTDLATPGAKGNWGADNFTYCNPMRLADEKGRIYLLHRAVGQDPRRLQSLHEIRVERAGHNSLRRHGRSSAQFRQQPLSRVYSRGQNSRQ